MQHKPTVILVSFDGMRHDYLDRGITPNFDALSRRGARAAGLIPIFPSQTFPNHYSIVTGLYADGHGLVKNSFYDDTLGARYSMSDSRAVADPRFYRGEPIWSTAERQGMVTASLFWVGSEQVTPLKPTHVWRFSTEIPDSARINALRDWLNEPAVTRPHFIAIYFPVVDDAGHRYGPDAAETVRSIVYLDSILGVIDGLAAARPASDSISIVVVSDHGMAEAPNWVYLSDYIDTNGLESSTGPVTNLWFKGDTARMRIAYTALRRMPHARVYHRSELPRAWHYNTPRAGDIIIVADDQWQIGTVKRDRGEYPANHGYPPEMKDMQGIFVATGPRIREGVWVDAFENVHVYPLLAELLRIEPARDVDGRISVLRGILR